MAILGIALNRFRVKRMPTISLPWFGLKVPSLQHSTSASTQSISSPAFLCMSSFTLATHHSLTLTPVRRKRKLRPSLSPLKSNPNMMEVVEGELCLLEVPEVKRCMLLCILEAVDNWLCLLEEFEAPEVMRCVLLCMLEAVDGRLCSLEAPEVMRCVLLCMLEAVDGTLWLLEVREVMRCVLI